MGDVGDITHRLPAVAEPQFRRLGHFSFTSATAHMVPMFESSAGAIPRAPPASREPLTQPWRRGPHRLTSASPLTEVDLPCR